MPGRSLAESEMTFLQSEKKIFEFYATALNLASNNLMKSNFLTDC